MKSTVLCGILWGAMAVNGFSAERGIPIGGMHLQYPAIGRVERAGTGFRFIPAP
jgi:hypothetical protein